MWWAQYFSCWLTGLVHTQAEPMDQEIAQAELRTVVSRESARRLLAENYVGIASTVPTATAPAR